MDRRDFFRRTVGGAGMIASGAISAHAPESMPHAATDPAPQSNALAADRGLPPLLTGFDELDRVTGGLRRGSITAIAGRPSTGRSTLALNIASQLALNRRVPAIYLSAPRGHCEVAAAVRAWRADVDRNAFRRDPSRFDVLQKILAERAGLLIDDRPLLTSGEIRDAVAKLHRSAGAAPGVLVVDQLALLGVEADGASDCERMAAAMRMLQALAADLDIAVIVIADVGAAVERRRDKRPRLTDLAPQSIPIARAADLVMLLHRDELYRPDSPMAGTVEIDVARNRHGVPGRLHLAFRPEFARFET